MAKIAAVSMRVVHDKAVNQNVALIVFPELSLQGFGPSMAATDPDSAWYQHDTAELVPEGDACRRMIALAQKYQMYICWGMAEQDASRCDVIYNTAVLVGPEGYVGRYRKVHQPGTERLYFFPGDTYPVFDTKLGKIGIMICYDKMYPEPARMLRLKGAELILCPTAWPANEEREDDQSLHLYLMANEMRAVENMVSIVDSNIVSDITPNGFECGHSRILNPFGMTLATTGFQEGMAVAELNPAEAIKACVCRAMIGTTNFIKDRRPDTYGALVE